MQSNTAIVGVLVFGKDNRHVAADYPQPQDHNTGTPVNHDPAQRVVRERNECARDVSSGEVENAIPNC